MEKNEKTNARKTGKVIAVIVTTMLAAASFGALVYAVREMKHEGLTYSQWYEGSIRGFYSCLLITLVFLGLFLFALAALLRKKNGGGRERLMRVLVVFFTVLTLAFAVLSAVRHGNAVRAAGEGAECLEPYIRDTGNSLVCALVSLEAGIASFFGWKRAAKKE